MTTKCKECGNITYGIDDKDYICHLCVNEKILKRNKEIKIIEENQKILTEYSKYLEKRGYMDCDWHTEGNTVNDFLKIK